MRKLPPSLLASVNSEKPTFEGTPLYLGLGRNPWRIMVAAQLNWCWEANHSMLRQLFTQWPAPGALAASDDALGAFLPHLHRSHIRRLQRVSLLYTESAFADLRDLHGCNAYVCDAVGLFCFGDTALQSLDPELLAYAEALRCKAS